MTRSVKPEEYTQKRNAILDVAARYITTKGYEQMTTQDLLEALQISRGAFYHYFESKQALLMALVERIGEQAEQLVLPMASSSVLPAQDKLLRVFAVLNQHKQANLDLLFLLRRPESSSPCLKILAMPSSSSSSQRGASRSISFRWLSLARRRWMR